MIPAGAVPLYALPRPLLGIPTAGAPGYLVAALLTLEPIILGALLTLEPLE